MPPTPLRNISPTGQSASQMRDVLVSAALGGYAAVRQSGQMPSPPPMPGIAPMGAPMGAPPMPPAGPMAMAAPPMAQASAAPAAPPPSFAPPAFGGTGAAPAPEFDMNAPTPIADKWLPPAQPQGAIPAFATGGVMPETVGNSLGISQGISAGDAEIGEIGGTPAGSGMEPDQLMANVTPAADLFSAIARLRSGEPPDAIRSSLIGGGEMEAESGKPEGALEPAPDAFLSWLSNQDEPANEVVQDMVEAYAADPGIADQLWSAVKAAIADPEERKELPRDLLALASKAGSAPSAKKAMRAAEPMTETPSAPPMPERK